MNEKNLKEMDKKLMAAMKELRDREVSDGILKGFSTSVERRILARKKTETAPRRFLSPAWAPVLAVMVLASLVVLRGPQTVEYAQLEPSKVTEIEEEMAALKEVGVWSDDDDSILGSSDEVMAQELELSSEVGGSSVNIA